MTVLFPYCDAQTRGSPALRERIYPLVLDVEPTISEDMDISKTFFNLLGEFKASEPYSYDTVRIDSKVLSDMCSGLVEGTGRASVAKKGKSTAPRNEDDDWPNVHEEAYSYGRVDWPPNTESIRDLLPREAEVVYLANAMFPVQAGPKGYVWEFMDANHSLERTLRFPPARCPKTKEMKPLRNPWKTVAPTFTAGSKIAARKWHVTGSDPTVCSLEVRRLHPLELMAMNGWGVSFWKDSRNPFADSVSPEVVSDMAGNMWNAWSYMCIEMALAGCCNWTEASRRTALHRLKHGGDKQEQLEADGPASLEADGPASLDPGSDDSSVYVPTAELMPKDAMSDDDVA